MKISVDYQDLNNNETSNEKKVNKLVNNITSEENIQSLKESIFNDLQKQDASLKERLMQRKKKKEAKSRAVSPSTKIQNEIDKKEYSELIINTEDITKTLDFTSITTTDKFDDDNKVVRHYSKENFDLTIENDDKEVIYFLL